MRSWYEPVGTREEGFVTIEPGNDTETGAMVFVDMVELDLELPVRSEAVVVEES